MYTSVSTEELNRWSGCFLGVLSSPSVLNSSCELVLAADASWLQESNIDASRPSKLSRKPSVVCFSDH